jgi:hypothetical protein
LLREKKYFVSLIWKMSADQENEKHSQESGERSNWAGSADIDFAEIQQMSGEMSLNNLRGYVKLAIHCP